MNASDKKAMPQGTQKDRLSDGQGPWANAWCMDAETFSASGNQARPDHMKEQESNKTRWDNPSSSS